MNGIFEIGKFSWMRPTAVVEKRGDGENLPSETQAEGPGWGEWWATTPRAHPLRYRLGSGDGVPAVTAAADTFPDTATGRLVQDPLAAGGDDRRPM